MKADFNGKYKHVKRVQFNLIKNLFIFLLPEKLQQF